MQAEWGGGSMITGERSGEEIKQLELYKDDHFVHSHTKIKATVTTTKKIKTMKALYFSQKDTLL